MTEQAWCRELEQLQDRVPPRPAAEVVEVLEQELGQSVQQAFADFQDEASAAASLAQVCSSVVACKNSH